MKKICITQSNKKFNTNIIYYEKVAKFYQIDTSMYSIYKMYYSLNKDIDIFIFNVSCINKEVISFINDLDSEKIIIVYVDNTNTDALTEIKNKNIKYIVDNHINFDGIKIPKFIINDILYLNISNNTCKKSDQILYFLDFDIDMPKNISDILYPNTKLPVKMFNNKNIQHVQNIGYIDEKQRRDLLIESKYMIYNDTQYLCEATLCGCVLIDGSKKIDMSEYTDMTSNCDYDYTTYSQFLKDNIL